MQAAIYVDEETLAKLEDMGIEIAYTEDNAVIPDPFMHKDIRERVEAHVEKRGDAEYNEALMSNEKLMDELMSKVIRSMEKSLRFDGSLSWDEAEDCIWNSYTRGQQEFNRKRNAGR